MRLSQKLFCITALIGSLCAADAYADAVHEGFDARLGISALILAHSGPGAGDTMIGVNGTISLGYRFQRYIGVYVDQDLGGVWSTSGGDDYDEESSGAFHGGSFAVVRGIFGAYYDDIEFSVGGGPGAMYGAGDGSDACFAIRLTAGFAYYVTDSIGIGVGIDYNLGFIKPKDEFEIEMHLVHQINPGLRLNINF
ncbi:MAG: outer membrane beta-barrel protein [Proteobacteria bacterium]|nr:outer membrane beta-barrel protein [Pseudomonadota bacterium]